MCNRKRKGPSFKWFDFKISMTEISFLNSYVYIPGTEFKHILMISL